MYYIGFPLGEAKFKANTNMTMMVVGTSNYGWLLSIMVTIGSYLPGDAEAQPGVLRCCRCRW